MELGALQDVAILLGMLVVLMYGLSAETPSGSINMQTSPASGFQSEPSKICEEMSWESADTIQEHRTEEDDDSDFEIGLPCPPNFAIREAMDAFYLPMAPAFHASPRQERATVTGPLACRQDSLMADVASPSVLATPRVAGPLLGTQPHSGGLSSPRHRPAAASSMAQLSPSRPASPVVTVLRGCALAALTSEGSQSRQGSPRLRLAAPLHVDVGNGFRESIPGSSPPGLTGRELHSEEGAESRGETASDRSSTDGSNASDSDSGSRSSSEQEMLGGVASAASGTQESGISTSSGGDTGVPRADPPSPVSVLFRAAAFEKMTRGQECPRSPPCQAATPKSAGIPRDNTGSGPGSEGGSLSCVATASRASTSMAPTPAMTLSRASTAGAKGVGGYSGRYTSGGGGAMLRTPVRPPLSPGGGGAGFGSGGGSTWTSPSYLELARALQLRSLASASPSSPNTPSPVSAKRLAKPNMPRISGL